MIEYTPEARRQISDLLTHFLRLGRLEAAKNLARTLNQAEQRIGRDPGAGLPAPRPYPALALRGFRWMKAGRYWIAYRPSQPAVIVGVFFEAADIPARL